MTFAQDVSVGSNTLWAILIVLLIICAAVWLFKNLR